MRWGKERREGVHLMSRTKLDRHPEQQDNERCIGNYGMHEMRTLKERHPSMRIGNEAYDHDGNRHRDHNLVPVFVPIISEEPATTKYSRTIK